jgi:hypothetical protein
MKTIIVFITALCLMLSNAPGQTLFRQRSHSPPEEAPFFLSINGPGHVIGPQDGQMLQVGRDYSMTAIPNRGHHFLGWNPVNVFTFVEYTVDESGNSVASTNTILSPIPGFIHKPALKFSVGAPEVIFNLPGVRTVIRSSGWQANFSDESHLGPDVSRP